MLQFRWSLTKTEDNYERQGTFWISTSAGDFPCRGWRDYPLSKLITCNSDIYNFIKTPYIMKRYLAFGPYYILLDISLKDALTIHFLRSYLPQPLEKLSPVVIPFFDFCKIVLETSRTLLETYHLEKLGTPIELESLKHAMELLSSMLPRDQ